MSYSWLVGYGEQYNRAYMDMGHLYALEREQEEALKTPVSV